MYYNIVYHGIHIIYNNQYYTIMHWLILGYPCIWYNITQLYYTISGWWYTYPSEKYEFVSWDDDIPNSMDKNKNVPNHQPAIIMGLPIILIMKMSGIHVLFRGMYVYTYCIVPWEYVIWQTIQPTIHKPSRHILYAININHA